MMHDYGRYCRPELVRLLEAVNLDVAYERAEGDRLWYERDGEPVEVLDLVGGYGAGLFGHHHPALVAEARRLFDEQRPVFAQGSIRSGAAALARALADRLGDYVTILTNSGAETVEAALKHAFLEREKTLFWAVKGGFHGKTLGAVQLTESYREPFQALGYCVRFLDPDDPATWPTEEASEVAAAFFEPIRGEGGVRLLPEAFVAWLRETCRAHDIPLVADEIQSGMGRTGTFLACEQLGLEPDYICLSKALGGGLAKIGALLIRRARFVEPFSMMHTSTFAEDEHSTRLALKALELLDEDDLPARCTEKGAYLVERLEALRERFPDAIEAVRGRGLMVGLELKDQTEAPSNILRLVSLHDYLGAFAAAYLLNVHHLRVAPTLSSPTTLRIQPSAYIDNADLDRFVEGVAQLCEALQFQDAGHLMSFLMRPGEAPPPTVDYRGRHPFKQETPRTRRRVAFLGHLIDASDLGIWDPALQPFSNEELDELVERTGRLFTTQIFDRVHVRSTTGEALHLSCICLVLSSQQLETAFRSRDYQWIMDKIEDAVALARDSGCQVIGLGGFSSILTGNCKRITTDGIRLTTGNSLTAGMGIVAMKEAAAERGIDLAQARLGVIGAQGNISSTYALMMAPHVAELVLIVRNLASPTLEKVVDEIYQVAPDVTVSLADSIDAIRECQLVVAASNSAKPLIQRKHIGDGPMVICDISIPHDVAPDIEATCPNVTILQGGVVRLPYNDDFVIGGIPLEPGHIFACLAETVLMGFDENGFPGSIGAVTPDGVERTLEMAQRHGFTLGRMKTERSF